MRRLPWKKIFGFGVPGVLLALVALFVVGYLSTTIPKASALSTNQSTVIRYAGGEELARLGINRVQVPLSQVSDPAQKAVLAAEDRGYYSEPGISLRGIARALFTNIKGGGTSQGGSTITQQYAKNAYLTQQRTYSRKLREVFIALKMTRERTKEQVLGDYLNTIYFGRGAYGIEAASKVYFGPTASAATLTPEQGAVLAASIRSPTGYDPSKHPQAARDRWNYVLDGMVHERWLSAVDRTAAVYPQVVAPGAVSGAADLSGPDGHLTTAVQDELAARGFPEDQLNAGGLVVQTTLRKPAQDAAVAAVQKVTGADRAGAGLQGALVAVEPGTGAVVAYYGGANGQGLDYAGGVAHRPGDNSVIRQPGSSFKPYVLATALSQGISLSSTFDGSSPRTFPGYGQIKNFGNSSFGPVDLVTATQNSINTAYFDLGLKVGPAKVAATAHAAGIPGDVTLASTGGQVDGGIALGTYEVHVIDQASGFATFADGGQAAPPFVVASVTRGGKEVYAHKVALTTAFSPQVAADATYAMQQVVRAGSGTRAQLSGGRPAAGKTGTTSDAKDVWFVGFTPQLSAAVWFGFGDPKPIEVAGTQATGGALSSGVWKAFMDAAMKGLPVKQFPPRAFVGRAQGGVVPRPSRTATPTPSATSSRTTPPTTAPPATAPPTGASTTSPPGATATPPKAVPPNTLAPNTPAPNTLAPNAPASGAGSPAAAGQLAAIPSAGAG